eukprot:gene17871-biopygen2366
MTELGGRGRLHLSTDDVATVKYVSLMHIPCCHNIKHRPRSIATVTVRPTRRVGSRWVSLGRAGSLCRVELIDERRGELFF